MKQDNERPYHDNISHELVSDVTKSDGCLKVDTETGWEIEHDHLADKMVEQTNPSELSYVKAEHRNGDRDKSGHVVIEDGSYDKDVMEIKLPDTVSSDYGSHFVKDVCIDEGALPHQKISAEKVIDEKLSPNIDSSKRDKNGDLREETRDDPTKSALELKPESVLPVEFANDDHTKGQHSSQNEYDLQGRKTRSDFTGDLNDEKLSLKQLFGLESAKDSQQTHTVNYKSSESHNPSLDGAAIGQVVSNDCHEVGAIASKTSDLIHSGLPSEVTANSCSVAVPEGAISEGVVVAAALDTRGSKQVNHYNPFIAYGSLEDTWEPEYSLPTIADAATIVPICPVEKTDSFSDLVNVSLEVLNVVETAEARVQAVSSGRLRIDASEKSNDHSKSLVDEVTDTALDGTAVASSLLPKVIDPSDVNSETHPKCDIDSVHDMRGFNPRDAEDDTNRSKGNIENKSSMLVQKESVVEQHLPDGAKVTARIGPCNPFESSFSGPSITSGPASSSGHIPYSGNISLRSDSSTTSARSFAFPVLQTEWNSSPVKMAKADRRRFRRHRGWRNGLLCCKF